MMLFLIGFLQGPEPVATMASGPNDRLVAEAFRSDTGLISPEALVEGGTVSVSAPIPMGYFGTVMFTRATDAEGRMVFLVTPLAGTAAKQNQACRITEVRKVGADNASEAINWCTRLFAPPPTIVPRLPERPPA